MGVFDFLKELPFFSTLSFQRYPDSFAMTREALYKNLTNVLQAMFSKSGEKDSSVFLAAHFPEEFFEMQNVLDRLGVEYRIVTRPLDAQWFADSGHNSQGVVYLALAEFLIETTFSGNESFASQMALIVVDRHPEPFRDEALEQFARSFPAVTRMGYFLALEDRVLASVINETTLLVLKQMGIEDQGLISSGIISKRITKVLAREQKARTGEGQVADSAETWYEINAGR